MVKIITAFLAGDVRIMPGFNTASDADWKYFYTFRLKLDKSSHCKHYARYVERCYTGTVTVVTNLIIFHSFNYLKSSHTCVQ